MKNTSLKILLLLAIFSAALGNACQSAPGGDLKADGASGSIETFMPAHVRVVFKRSCETCHAPDGRGITGVAPDLQRARPRSLAEWEQYLRDPHPAHPGATAPPVWLNEDEIKAVAGYLPLLPTTEQTPLETPAAR